MQPLVYISLVNWNHAEKTIKCIRCLHQQTYPNYQIVIVDNASSDDSVAQIKAAHPDVLLLRSDTNIGYAGGHEISMRQALSDGADLLWILNNDTQIEGDALAQLVNAYQLHGDGLYGGVPLTYGRDNQRIVRMHRKYLNTNYREVLFDRDSFAPYETVFPQPKAAQRVAAISGSCFMMPLSIVRQHGYMDTDYFLYSEEIDYCFRLSRAGVPMWIVPSAIIWHEGEGSSTGVSSVLSDIVQYYRIRNQLVRIQRYGSRWDTTRAIVKNMLLVVLSIARGHFRRAGFMLRGLWDGLRRKLGKTYPPENLV